MEKITIYLNEQLIIGQIYYLQQTCFKKMGIGTISHAIFKGFLAAICSSGIYKNTWNNNNSHRFEILKVTYEDPFIIIKGISRNAESFNELDIEYIAGYIEHTQDVKAWYLGSAEAGETSEELEKEKEAKEMFTKILNIIGIIIIGVVLIFTIPFVWKKIKRKR